MLWCWASWTIAGTDYKPILNRVSISVSNQLTREGMRNQLGALGTGELAISRTPLGIFPQYEKVQVSYGLRDRLPAALEASADWGAVTLYAEQPGTGASRKWLKVVISNNYLNRYSQNQTQSNQPLTLTADTSSRVISVTYGASNPPGA